MPVKVTSKWMWLSAIRKLYSQYYYIIIEAGECFHRQKDQSSPEQLAVFSKQYKLIIFLIIPL